MSFLALPILTLVVCHNFVSSKPCPQALSYAIPADNKSIRHTARFTKCCRCLKNVFIDDRGFPYLTDAFYTLLHNVNGGLVLHKLKHPPPPLNVANPSFSFQYDEALHGLDLSHLDQGLQDTIYAMIRKYWAVFDDHGVFIPVKNYECVIDTGNCPGITIKKIQYGAKESPLMRKAMAGLEKVGHIKQVHDGRWLFKAILAPKPHQEHLKHINEFM